MQSLCDLDIDLILMIDPRWRHPSVTFTPGAVLCYLLRNNSRAVVVHRINECDERKNTKKINDLLRRSNYCADHTVFVGSWLKDLPVWQDEPQARHSVILNGADDRVFNARNWRPWSGQGPLRIVTHHWGANWMKGFDIYERLDRMLQHPDWKGRIAFTYVGNLPPGFRFRNAHYIKPLNDEALASELKAHHAYLTASINEPGGNHQNEGALCGLPLLYRRSGCLTEYCDGFGLAFDETDFENALNQLLVRYDELVAAMPSYPHKAVNTCASYLVLFDELVKSRDEITSSRRLWRNPWLLIRNQLSI